MTARTKTLALLATSATIAGGTLGVAGATADTTPAAGGAGTHQRHQGAGQDKLAQALSVTPAQLQAALKDAKTQTRPQAADALAKALGVSTDQLKAAVQQVRGSFGDGKGKPDTGAPGAKPQGGPADAQGGKAGHRGWHHRGKDGGKFAAALAGALKIDQAKVVAAFKDVRTQTRTAFVAVLAKDLGKTPDQVTQAFASTRPAGPSATTPGAATTGNATTPGAAG